MKWDGVRPEKISGGAKFTFWRKSEEREQTDVGALVIRFRPDLEPPVIEEIKLEVVPGEESLIPSELKRFAWDRWISGAETIHRAGQPPLFQPAGEFRESMAAYQQAWSEYHAALQAAVGHPGSRGRDDEHYQRIAALYRNLAGEGERAPIRKLADDLGVKRNTVSGWIKEARKRGFLPKGSRGRVG